MAFAVTPLATYEERPSSGSLAEFVECVWWARGEGGHTTPVLPDGCQRLPGALGHHAERVREVPFFQDGLVVEALA